MSLNEIAYPAQAVWRQALVAGRQRKMPEETAGDADAQGSAEAFDQDPVAEAAFDLLGQTQDDLAEQRVLQPGQKFKPGCGCSKLRYQGGIQICIPDHLNEPCLRLKNPKLETGRIKPERAGRGARHFPGDPVLQLEEDWRELIPEKD